MKVTIDLPDELVTKAETVASQREITFEQLVLQGLSRVLADNRNLMQREVGKHLVAALRGGNYTERVVPLKREEIYDRHKDRFN